MYGETMKPGSYWHKNPRGLPAALLTHILRSSAPDSTTVGPLSEEDVKSVFKKKYLQQKGDAKQTSSGQEIDEASLEKIGLSRGKLIDFFKRMKVAGKGGSETVNVPPPSELVEAPDSSQQVVHEDRVYTTDNIPEEVIVDGASGGGAPDVWAAGGDSESDVGEEGERRAREEAEEPERRASEEADANAECEASDDDNDAGVLRSVPHSDHVTRDNDEGSVQEKASDRYEIFLFVLRSPSGPKWTYDLMVSLQEQNVSLQEQNVSLQKQLH